jgi:hypothetical protein
MDSTCQRPSNPFEQIPIRVDTLSAVDVDLVLTATKVASEVETILVTGASSDSTVTEIDPSSALIALSSQVVSRRTSNELNLDLGQTDALSDEESSSPSERPSTAETEHPPEHTNEPNGNASIVSTTQVPSRSIFTTRKKDSGSTIGLRVLLFV